MSSLPVLIGDLFLLCDALLGLGRLQLLPRVEGEPVHGPRHLRQGEHQLSVTRDPHLVTYSTEQYSTVQYSAVQ